MKFTNNLIKWVLFIAILALYGCGDANNTAETNSPSSPSGNQFVSDSSQTDNQPVRNLSSSENQAAVNLSLSEASRLLSQATYGMDYAGIQNAATLTAEQWLEQQFSKPATFTSPLVTQWELINAGTPEDSPVIDFYLLSRFAWWNVAITAEDQLRQRVAYALSQIFVISDRVDELADYPQSLANYYDTLLRNSFGNFRDLLRDVSLSPAMGIYLSHLGNAKTDVAAGRFPDENYAREVMQLFSIGLDELNADGSRKLDAQGNAIATYSNTDIREFAKIFTGLVAVGPVAENIFDEGVDPAEIEFDKPMYMVEAFHEPGTKQLLDSATVPAGQTGMQDIEAAIDVLFNHSNVGPFIALRLIQRLVTSNPSPAYIARISAVFADNGQAVRGDMQAVVKAILLDTEASAHSGRVREPVLRYLAVLRQFHAVANSGTYSEGGDTLERVVGQHPMSSRTVFNFYSPGYIPPGSLQAAGLKAPEMQITTDSSIIGLSNLIFQQTIDKLPMESHDFFGEVTLDLSVEIALASDVDALIDRLDLLLTYNTLTATTRQIIRAAIEPLDDDENEDRVLLALYLFLISPDYATQI